MPSPSTNNPRTPELEIERSLVIVGANGVGKSRMGIWLEANCGHPTHRVGAQRALTFTEHIQRIPYSSAERNLWFGRDAPDAHVGHRSGHRWGQQPHNHLLNDFDVLLALLVADKARRNDEYVASARAAENKVPVPLCRVDTILGIWQKVLPHRNLSIDHEKVSANSAEGSPYLGRDMSDGERVALYLMGQSLSAPPHSVVIVDEPEIHLHRAVQDLLWNEIECARPDCCFVYITHDLDFATLRTGATKIVLTAYDGSNWAWEALPESTNLPEHVLLRVVGSRRPAMFVEGDEGSLDASVYSALFPEHLVLPRGSSRQVIDDARSMRAIASFHRLETDCLVDRDFRSAREVETLRATGIGVLDVAEVESLLITEEVMNAIALTLGKNPRESVDPAMTLVKEKFTEMAEDQAKRSVDREIEYRLAGIACKGTAAHDVQAMIGTTIAGFNISEVYEARRMEYVEIAAHGTHREILTRFNNKGLLPELAKHFGLTPRGYRDQALRLLQEEQSEHLRSGLREYVLKRQTT